MYNKKTIYCVVRYRVLDIFIPKSPELASILNSLNLIPVSTGIKNSQGLYIECNQYTADFAGKNSPKDLHGCSDLDLIWKEHSELYTKHNKLVEATNKPYFFIEPCWNTQNKLIHLLSIRAPLKNYTKSISGIIGVCIPLNQISFQLIMSQFFKVSEQLNLNWNNQLIIQLVTKGIQLHQKYNQGQRENQLFNYGDIIFTLREAQCLHYYLNNYTAEQTAKKLFISSKTVEFHLANIKLKINCTNKSEITNKAIDKGFIDIMFIQF
jgi:DNA-binding CsgD family transcriptional regulator